MSFKQILGGLDIWINNKGYARQTNNTRKRLEIRIGQLCPALF